MTQRWPIIYPLALSLIVVFAQTRSARSEIRVTAEKSPHGVVIKVDDKLFTEYRMESGGKPVLWPVIGPTGKAVTRAYPIAPNKGENEKHDHPHHRSLWFTHGEVNGVDFWSEKEGQGKIVHREFEVMRSGKQATVVARNDWIGPNGKKVCEDRRKLEFGATSDRRWIDFEITLVATSGDLTFGDTKEGTFGVRVAGTMKTTAKLGGRIVNSRGETDVEAWGQPAEWVDYYGPVGDQVLGVAILNHPSSFRFPTFWHVRTYGLFAANPFGRKDFPESSESTAVQGAYTVPSGQDITLRYRVLLHTGETKSANIMQAFAQYAQQQ